MPDFTIRGNPSGVRSRAATTRAKADSFMTTGDALAKVTTDGWNSRAADRFRDKFDTEPERWREAGDGFVTAASALEAYAGALETAQKRAQWAEGEYARGEQVTDQARSAYDSDVARAKDNVQTAAAAGQHMTLTILPFHDPGAAIRQGALDEYASAKRDLEAAAHTCADGVRAGCAAAPAKRKWYEKVGAAVGGFLEGAGEALMDLGKLAAFLTNPAVFVFNDMMSDAMSGMTSEEIAAKYELKLEDAQGLLDALQEDPLEFGKNIGKAMLDWDTWADDPARALGHLLPDAVIAVLTAGSGTVATRGAKGGVDALDALAGMSKVDDLAELRHLDDLGGLSRLDDLDPSRIYRMEDGLDHFTTFAPEQLGARSGLDGLLDDALSDTPWSRQDLIDKINTPTHDLSPADRALLNDIRDQVPMPGAGDTMQKVITPSSSTSTSPAANSATRASTRRTSAAPSPAPRTPRTSAARATCTTACGSTTTTRRSARATTRCGWSASGAARTASSCRATPTWAARAASTTGVTRSPATASPRPATTWSPSSRPRARSRCATAPRCGRTSTPARNGWWPCSGTASG